MATDILLLAVRETVIAGKPMKKLFLLPHQVIAGKPVDEKVPVSCATNIQNNYEVGSIFASNGVRYISSTSYNITNVSETGTPTKIGVVNKTPLSASEAPTKEMMDLFKDYQINYPSVIENLVKEAGNPIQSDIDSSVTGVSVIERLMKAYPAPSIEKDGFYIKTEHWRRLLLNIIKRRNTLLMGPTGTGKTQMVYHLAKSMGIPLRVYDMGAAQDPVATFIGVHRIVKTEDGTTVSKFDFSPFTEDIQKPCIILLDEISRASALANNILFPVLDEKQRILRADIAGSAAGRAEFKMHEQCIIFATMNDGAEYTGTEQLDEALKDRFKPVLLDYMPEDQEIKLLQTTGISEKSAKFISKVAKTVRDKWKSGLLSRPLSIRETMTAAVDIKCGLPVTDAMMENFLYFYDGEGGESSERAVVKNIIAGRA